MSTSTSLLSILIVFATASQLYAQGQVTFIATDNMDGTCTITFDGKDQDGKRKWVNLPDLTIFGAGWLKVDTEPHFTENPCW